MKKIGIITRNFSLNSIFYNGVHADVYKSLSEFDITPIGISMSLEFSKIIEAVKLCDGIILTGGNTLTNNDFRLVKYLYEHDIPTLGICLGMQSMVETYNGKQETKISNHNTEKEYAHEILINPDSLLYKILNKRSIMVNSRHNYAVTNTNFFINAKSNDNIIEGIEDQNKRFFLGLQWHPESLIDDNTWALFDFFIKSL